MASSQRNELVANVMQADDTRPIALIGIVTKHRVTDPAGEPLEIVCFCEDGDAEGMRGIAAFGLLFDHEDDLVHAVTVPWVGGLATAFYPRVHDRPIACSRLAGPSVTVSREDDKGDQRPSTFTNERLTAAGWRSADPSVSLDLLVKSLLGLGASRSEVVRVIAKAA